jgi:uncharacterized SAM-binding protein YcdF (DUF218 family)
MNPRPALVVLGSPNDPDGVLGTLAVDRLQYVIDTQRHCQDRTILCTGGFGAQFNTSASPHADYARAYLAGRGVAGSCFLPSAYSSNTVEDAVLVKEILLDHALQEIVVVSSDFHLSRVKLIFGVILAGFGLDYVGVAHPTLQAGVLAELIRHERSAIQAITENGLHYRSS